MNKIKKLIFSLVFLMICTPVYRSVAQDTVQLTETDQANYYYKKVMKGFEKYYKKVEKDKEKEKQKDDISVNGRFFLSLVIDIVTLLIIVLLVYYPNNRRFESVFTFFMFNLLIFMLTFVLNKIKISMGAAFGLFAVFSMLRYRTEGISMKDMTYLFVFIAVGLISAIQLEFYELVIINGLIVLFVFFLDGKFFFRIESSKMVEYENIELIKPENYNLLLEDLKKRTGLEIHHFKVQNINFLKDTANIIIYFYEKAR